jgi:predicted AlkP superfamily phosphohydrolase/phosphomutase
VEPRDYDALCEQIAIKLHELVDPETEERLVERVYRKEELYSGPYTDQAPDLVVQWRDYTSFTRRDIDQGDGVFGENLTVDASEYPYTGTHRLDGVFMIKGPHIRPRYEVHPNIIDLAPTILYILGETISPNMDGRVLHEIFEHEFFQTLTMRDELPEKKIPIDTKETLPLSEEEETSVRERLKSLGYLD